MLAFVFMKVFAVAVMAAGIVSASVVDINDGKVIKRWAHDDPAPVTVFSTVTITAPCSTAPATSDASVPATPATSLSTVTPPIVSAPGTTLVPGIPGTPGSSVVSSALTTITSDGTIMTMTPSFTTLTDGVLTTSPTTSGSITTFSAGSSTSKPSVATSTTVSSGGASANTICRGVVLGWLFFTMFAAI